MRCAVPVLASEVEKIASGMAVGTEAMVMDAGAVVSVAARPPRGAELYDTVAVVLTVGVRYPTVSFSRTENVITTGPEASRIDGTRTLISHAAGQPSEGGNAVSVATGLSSSGLRVLFQSHAGNLVEGASDDDFDPDAFVQDLEEIGPVLVSHAVGAPMVPADLGAEAVGISADGSTVLLFSASADLDADTLNGYGYENIYSVRLDPRTALFVDGFE